MTPQKQWFSCLLLFEMRMRDDPQWARRLESLMLIRAVDRDEAAKRAKELGLARADAESVRDADGSINIGLTFCGLETLDLVGDHVEDREVWSHLSEATPGEVRVDLDHTPTQTI